MLRGRTVKLDPTPTQAEKLSSHVGAARFAYNTVLSHVQDCYARGEKIDLSGYGLRRWWNANKEDLAPWWKENSKEAYSNAILNLGKALRRFFNSVKAGKSRKIKVGFPRPKRKGVKDSYTITTGSFGVTDVRGITLPRIGRIHTLEPLNDIDPETVKSVTIRRKADGWYASLTLDLPDTEPQRKTTGQTVGIDVGLESYAVFSTGEVFDHPKALKRYERKRRRLAQSVSRKKLGSSNREKAKVKLARLDQKIGNIRLDARHKLSRFVADNYDEVAIEGLSVSSMMKNRRLAKAIADSAWYSFRTLVEYKCEKQDVRVTVADVWYASSKTCSTCGQVKAKLDLSERVFECQSCGLVLDRDLNAAKNLDSLNPSVAASTAETLNACGREVSPGMENSNLRRTRMKQESSVTVLT